MGINQEVIDQAEEIRQAGPVNMMDRKGVQYYAFQEDYFELVNWIEDNPKNYMDLLGKLGRKS